MFTVQTTVGFVGMISSTVLANLFMKLGASDNEEERWLLGLAGTRTLAGIVFFGVALILYTWLLRYIPLNVAQSLMAVQFIAVILASTWLLSEPMPSLRWVGIALITAGIVLVAFTLENRRAPD